MSWLEVFNSMLFIAIKITDTVVPVIAFGFGIGGYGERSTVQI